jgi:hypothetical protein
MISQYSKYYAPILDSCSVDTSVIIQKERDYCHLFATNNHDQFATSIIRKIGDYSLGVYLYQMSNDVSSYLIEDEIRTIYKTHIHLLKALSKLLDAKDPIVHYDLKGMNIFIHDTFQVPIIIDFGMSFTKSQLVSALLNPQKQNLNQFFWSYEAMEGVVIDVNWSIEVELLCYINISKDLNELITSSDIEDLKKVVSSYIKKDATYNLIDTTKFQDDMKQYLSSYKSKKWEILLRDLTNTWNTWDNYALALTYYRYLQDKPLNFNDNPFITNYKKLLERIVFATPETRRLGPKETMYMLLDLWRTDSDDLDIFNR